MGIRKRFRDFRDWCPQPPSRLPMKIRMTSRPVAVAITAGLILVIGFSLIYAEYVLTHPTLTPLQTPTATSIPTPTPTDTPTPTPSPSITPVSSPLITQTSSPSTTPGLPHSTPILLYSETTYPEKINASQGTTQQLNLTLKSMCSSEIAIPIENLTIEGYTSAIRWL